MSSMGHCHVCGFYRPREEFHYSSSRNCKHASKCKWCSAIINYRMKKAKWQGLSTAEAYREAVEVCRSVNGNTRRDAIQV